jgi:selenocysteine lyase/cysteine desulfurase
MQPQTQHFQLPPDIHYLNCAYMSPLPIRVEEAGIRGMMRKRNPVASLGTLDDFFAEAPKAKRLFGALVNAPASHIAIIPSASYGLQAAMSNVPPGQGGEVLVVSEEFGSGYYTAERWCRQFGKRLRVVEAPEKHGNRAAGWNERLLEAIAPDTAAVLVSSVHWADGTLFDLMAIGERCRAHQAVFVVDGTQSVGALPIDVQACGIDVLVCAAYKWLLGPYTIGLAYYAERFHQGVPLEETWMNRTNAAIVTNRIFYADDYKPDAGRFDMGEASNFVLMPMLEAGLRLLQEWPPAAIQQYCEALTRPLVAFLRENGYWVEDDAHRAKHLFGFTPPGHVDIFRLMEALKRERIYTSLRGTSVRVSPHVYNTPDNIEALLAVLRGMS